MTSFGAKNLIRLGLGLLVLGGFLALDAYQYQVFHLFAEGFNVVVSATLFIVVLNVRRWIGFGPVVFLGTVSGAVGLLDFLHVIAFPSMGLFPGYGVNLAAQFWVLARGLEALGFFLAFLAWNRRGPLLSWALPVLLLGGLSGGILAFARLLPAMYVDGQGLTALKVSLEYSFILLLSLSLVLLFRHRRLFAPETLRNLALALGTAIVAEVCFTLYVGPTDLFNVLGHFFKLVTYYFLYLVLIAHGLLAPYEGIFHQLQEANAGLEATVSSRTRELERSSHRFQSILEAAPWPLLVLASDEERVVCTALNPAAAELFGPASGRDWGELLAHAGFARPEALLLRIRTYLAQRTGDLPFDADLGSGEARRTFEMTLFPVDDAAVVAVLTDVTARRRALEVYQMQDQVFQLSGDFIVVLDREGQIQVHNPAWTRQLQLSSFDLVNRSWMDLIHPEDRALAVEALATLAASESASVEVRMTGSADIVRTVAWGLHSSVDHRLVYGVGRDVTVERGAEALLRQASKLESLGLVAGGIAHDFNNMLAGMFGFVELARLHCRAGKPEAVEAALDRSLQVFQRAKGLTRQLLAVSKGGTGALVVLDLAPVIRQAADFVLAGTSCSVDWQGMDGVLGPCEADADQLFQAFQNLFLNALQAMEGGGRLEVRVRQTDTEVRVEVEDGGPGIPPEARARIFEPFFSSKAKGTGLGLPIVASIAAKHGGRVEVIDGRGKGACFAFTLPTTQRLPTAPPPPPASFSDRTLRVLVMDDDPDIRSFLESVLVSWGHEVATATEGGEAIHLVQEALGRGSPFHVAVLDWTIRRGLGGAETLSAVKRLDPSLRIIVSTGYATPLSNAPGCDAILAKPFRLDELRQHLSGSA